ncbi:unnamed protein product [Allacma fusca]|uniref:Protein kinase domain-containing protein n=1 Tax=Allacma fusca TaxID=39272 RepID=A0A8J2P805_9HEXA|nr:unnamed protein product [Allacma fusca]
MGHSISLLKRKYVWLQGDTDEALAALKEDLVAALPKQKVIANNRVVISKDILAGGEYGVIYRGTFDGNSVAIKQSKSDVEYIKAFLCEIKVTHFIGDHPNITVFHGVVLEGIQHRVCLAAFELSAFGNLNFFLKEHDVDDNSGDSKKKIPRAGVENIPKMALKQSVLINFCKQIATAMAFIAEKKVVHRDLSTRSILVFQNNVVKITDFGMSRKLYDSPNYVQIEQLPIPMPWRWMPDCDFQSLNMHFQKCSIL